MGTALRILLVVVALLMLAGIYVVQWAQARLLEAGVQRLEWSELRLSGRELSLGKVSGLYLAEQGELEFEARNLRLVFIWESGPRFELIDLGEVDLDWQPAPLPPIDPMLLPDPAALEPPEAEAGEQTLPDLHDWFSYLDYLPPSSQIHALRIGLPCRTLRCELEGSLQAHRQGPRVEVTLALRAEDAERLDLSLELFHMTERIDLASELRLSGSEALSLASHWEGEAADWTWQGRLELPPWAGNDWLFAFLQPWLPTGTSLPESLPMGMQAAASWALMPGREPRVARDLVAGAVDLDARGEIPEPWEVAELGRVRGRLALALEGRNGEWRLHQGHAGLQLDRPSLPALEDIPAQWRPTGLALELKPEPGTSLHWQAQLPLALHAELSGPVRGTLAVRVLLGSEPMLGAEFENGQLDIAAPRVEQAGWSAAGVRARLPFSGRLTQELLTLQLGQAALLTAAAVTEPNLEVRLSELRLGAPGLALRLPLSGGEAATVASRVQLGVARLEHPSLLPQGWSANGEARLDQTGIGFRGGLAALGGLGLDVGFDWPSGRPWSAELRLQDIFLRAANPLAATLADWPPLLSLATGRVTGRLEVSGNPDLQRVDGRLEATGLAGIHDRIAFEGLNVPLDVQLRNDQLTLGLPGLSLTALDPGIPLGPVALRGRYLASLQAPLGGRLEIAEASVGLLGGRLVLEPGTLDLAQDTQAFAVNMEGLQLARLFEVYPAEGLAGHGTLDGRLPVRLSSGGIMIDSGTLDAREPGGVLQYRSDKLREMGRANPGMRELALALDDFRYTVLSSDLDYGSDGVLILGLRLEGSNPELQRGRPVHLNVRLEEDIPALLASLQLSSQVSDIIQRRVQERLLQRRLGP